MNPPLPFPQLVDSAPTLIATRHFALAGCVLLLWDHLLTFKEEIECIWKLPVEFSKVVFLFNRYFVAGSLCCSVYILLELRGPLSQEICHNYILFVSCASIVAITVANLVVTFHIKSLWEKQSAVTYALLITFCITYGVTLVCAGFSANDLQSHILWVPEIKSCVVTHKPMPLIGAWAGMVTFDIFVLVMLFANAVNRPYRENSEIVDSLHRDGIKFFTALLFLRSTNLLLMIFSSPGEIFLVFFLIWAAVSITLSRFILMIKATEKGGASTTSATMATTTILWRNNSGQWSRMSDLIELKAAP